MVSRRRTGGDVSADAEASVYALLSDGSTIEIRPARPDDLDAVRDMHTKMSPDNLYLRFFGVSPVAAEREARRLCREPAPDHAALLAVLGGELTGCGSYEVAAMTPGPLRSPWRLPMTCTTAASARCCWST